MAGRGIFSPAVFKQEPGVWLTATQRLMKGVWPWTKGPRSRLPKHFKVRYIELHMKEPLPVNYRKIPDRFERKIENTPIPIKYPEVANQGLWGGEGIVEGLYRSSNNVRKARDVWMWKPTLYKRLFYSEILDKWFAIAVTRRTLDMIDEAYGVDNYILATHEVDMKSKLGMKLKRHMLYALHNKDFHANDLAKQEEIYYKYKKFMIPAEEIEWLGLDIVEAENKLLEEAELERLAAITPAKADLMLEFEKEIKDPLFKAPEEKDPTGMMDSIKSWFSRKDDTQKSP